MNKLLVGNREQFENYLADELGSDNISQPNVFHLKPNEQKFLMEQIELYIEHFQFVPESEESSAIGIIYDAHFLTENQQNKLLKTIESINRPTNHYLQTTSSSKMILPLLSRYMVLNQPESTNFNYEQQTYIDENVNKLDNFKLNLVNGEFEKIILDIGILYDINTMNIDIYCSLIEEYLKTKQNPNLFTIYLQYKARISYNVDSVMQIEALLIELKNIRNY